MPLPRRKIRRPLSSQSPRGRTHGPAKLSDVARLAGVSPATASRALQRPELLAEETLARVRAAVEQLTYVPNGAAVGLAARKSNMVIAVIPSTFNPVFTDLVESLRLELGRAGLQLFLGLTEYDLDREEELITTVVRRRPDAIVLTGVRHSPNTRTLLANMKIPVVETWDLTPRPIDMLVGFSNAKVGRMAAEYLVRRGRKHLAMVVADDQRAQARRDGFLGAAKELRVGAVVEVAAKAPTSLAAGREAFSKMSGQGVRCDGVFCTSDQLALGVIYEACDRGIPVPDQLAVVGFGNHAGSAHTSPSLTTVAVDGARVGREAARMIVDRLAVSNSAHRRSSEILDVGCFVIARQSA